MSENDIMDLMDEVGRRGLRSTMTKLGEGSFRAGLFDPEAMGGRGSGVGPTPALALRAALDDATDAGADRAGGGETTK